LGMICIPNNRNDKEIELMYKEPVKLGIIQKFNYLEGISTSDIIERIKTRNL